MNHSTTNPKATPTYEWGPGPDPCVRRVKEAGGRGRSQIGVEKMPASAASHFCLLLDLDMSKCVILAVAALFSSGFRAILTGSRGIHTFVKGGYVHGSNCVILAVGVSLSRSPRNSYWEQRNTDTRCVLCLFQRFFEGALMGLSTTTHSAGAFLLRPNSSAAGLTVNVANPPLYPCSSKRFVAKFLLGYKEYIHSVPWVFFSSRNELPLIKSQRRLCREVNLMRPVLAC